MNLTVNIRGLDELIDQLGNYANSLEKRAGEICQRLAQIGYDVAYQIMSGHVYSGETINSLTIEERSPTEYVLWAESKALLFFEFGAGVNGGGHPQAGEFGFGPGTYPGQTHALDPKGWWFPTDDPNLIVRTGEDGQGYGHSYGNPPHMPFYNAGARIKEDLERVAKEVLSA